jgi:hypothetical protein
MTKKLNSSIILSFVISRVNKYIFRIYLVLRYIAVFFKIFFYFKLYIYIYRHTLRGLNHFWLAEESGVKLTRWGGEGGGESLYLLCFLCLLLGCHSQLGHYTMPHLVLIKVFGGNLIPKENTSSFFFSMAFEMCA